VELICPVCQKWTEIPEYQAFAGNRCRCRECWAVLRVESHRPFRVQVELANKKPITHVGSGAWQGGEEEDD